MKLLIHTVFVSALLFGNGAFAQTVGVFTSVECQFTATFPGTPAEAVDTVPLEPGELIIHSFIYNSDDQSGWFITKSEYPEAIINAMSTESFLDGSIDGVLSGIGISEATSEERIVVDGYSGRQFTGSNDEFTASFRVLLVENSVYQIGTVVPHADADDLKKAKQFIEGFQLLSSPRALTSRSINPFDANTLEPFSSKEGRFEVLMPADIVQKKDEVNTDYGKVDLYSFTGDAEGLTYMISYVDYPDAVIEMVSPNTLLQKGKTAAVENMQLVNVVEGLESELNGAHGLRFKGQNGSEFVLFYALLIDNRLYQVALSKMGSYPLEQNVNTYFDSFVPQKP